MVATSGTIPGLHGRRCLVRPCTALKTSFVVFQMLLGVKVYGFTTLVLVLCSGYFATSDLSLSKKLADC